MISRLVTTATAKAWASRLWVLTCFCHVWRLQAADLETTLTIEANRPGASISPAMWGVFFEDINFGADGGLYAELVKNRSFEFDDALMGWQVLPAEAGSDGRVGIATNQPVHAQNTHFLRLTLDRPGSQVELRNEGFRGMGVKEGAVYDLSVLARSTGAKPKELVLAVEDPFGRKLGEGRIRGFGKGWQKLGCSIRISATEPKARLSLKMVGPGGLDLDMVSLFPRETWKRRPNGLRPDLVQLLADLKPGFVRFPGGCIVEGHDLPLRYQWKTTLGPVDERKSIINRWNNEFKHRPAPDYFQSFGLGFYEYFLLCEDLGAEPLPILNCGMACQFNSGQLAPLDQLDPYIQDALDLIEFANGPASSPWGARRAAMGHKQPFHLKMLGIGNEQWGPQYIERYERFAKALKAKYPEVRLISSAGPGPADDKFHFAWGKLRELKADIVDEHCYARPDWFLDNSSRYDAYPRTGPKVFMGEYAAQSDKTVSVENRNNWECALSEAAYMIGMERNAGVVTMSSYAPLFGHEELWQWRPNLIWFDNLRAYGTPNYHVQRLFSRNRGDRVLPTRLSGAPMAANQQPRCYASAVVDEKARAIVIKVVNATANRLPTRLLIQGTAKVSSKGLATVLSSPKLSDENSLGDPEKVAPVTSPLAGISPDSTLVFKPWSLTVLAIPME